MVIRVSLLFVCVRVCYRLLYKNNRFFSGHRTLDNSFLPCRRDDLAGFRHDSVGIESSGFVRRQDDDDDGQQTRFRVVAATNGR
jgi:hypothetical protein